MNEDELNPIDLMNQVSNIITITVFRTMSERSVDFDALLCVMTNHGMRDVRVDGIVGDAFSIFDGYYDTHLSDSSCCSNSLTITLNKDGVEWVNTIEIHRD